MIEAVGSTKRGASININVPRGIADVAMRPRHVPGTLLSRYITEGSGFIDSVVNSVVKINGLEGRIETRGVK